MDEIRLSKQVTEIHDFLARYKSSCQMLVCEKVKYKLGDGGKGAFTFGQEFGKICSITLALGFKVIFAIPTLWRTRLTVPIGADKAYLRDVARSRFPKNKINLKNCDAFLIALYAKQLLEKDIIK